jgi:hypothetical protein
MFRPEPDRGGAFLDLRKPPNGLSQPNGSSIYFRLIVLMRLGGAWSAHQLRIDD